MLIKCPCFIDLVPLAIGATVVQSALYDVPGGYRAVLFDRFSGVRPDVSGTGLASNLYVGFMGARAGMGKKSKVTNPCAGHRRRYTLFDPLVAASNFIRCED